MAADPPLLWHIPISHYSEKARWALDWKRVPHRRRVAPPGLHPLLALAITRGGGYTAPVLVIDGRPIGDSTAIIAELERRWPERPLYPDGEVERRRALEIEEWFDEQLGPAIRRWAFYELTSEPESLAEVTAKQMETMPGPAPPFAGEIVKRFVGSRYGVGEARAEESRAAVVAGFDRLDAELARAGGGGGGAGDGGGSGGAGGGGAQFLVGDRFSVADLTAAALCYPLVQPPEGPWQTVALPEGVRRLRAELRDRPSYRWVEETFRRHRFAAAPAPSGALTTV
jgi:glutathione S-transferase